MTVSPSADAPFGPVRGLSPDTSRADVAQSQIFRNSFSTGATR